MPEYDDIVVTTQRHLKIFAIRLQPTKNYINLKFEFFKSDIFLSQNLIKSINNELKKKR